MSKKPTKDSLFYLNLPSQRICLGEAREVKDLIKHLKTMLKNSLENRE